MPGSISISNAQGAPTISPDADFGVCVIGYSSGNPVSSGQVTAPYSNPQSAFADLGIGDAADLLRHIITTRPSNPAPPGAFFYSTPATTPGVRGTITTSGVTGTATPAATSSTHPKGTWIPINRVLVGGVLGTGPIVIQTQLGVGGPLLPPQTITTALVYNPFVTVNGSNVDLGLGYTLGTSSQTLVTGDVWTESKTTPPMWGDTDLYNTGSPATGAFAAIAQSGSPCGIIVISEPVASGDFSTIVAGLNYLATFNKRPVCIFRFRDPNSGETDSQYVTAFQTFAQACRDARCAACVGSGWLTDQFSGVQYFRSGLPALVARLQACQAFPGRQFGERLAKSPAFGGDGPLPDFTLLDNNGNPISQAHDEFRVGGIDGPMSDGGGGGIAFCYQRAQGVAGTYISQAPVLYPSGSTVLTLMDARVTQGIQRELYAVAWQNIQGTDVVNGGILDPDVCLAMGQAMRQAILGKFKNEIANPDDPNLVVVNPAVTVSGPNVSITVAVNDRLFLYTNSLTITLYNIRSGS